MTSVAGATGITLTQPFAVINHVRIINKTGTAATFSLWVGLTGANTAGTEEFGSGSSVPANLWFDWYGMLTLSDTDFVVGGAGTATALTLTMTGILEFQ